MAKFSKKTSNGLSEAQDYALFSFPEPIGEGKNKWGYSSVGRAPALQAGGHEFESHYLHHREQHSRM